MSARGIFSYHNLDSTADLNARFKGLVAKGIYAGGRISVTGNSYTITISPYMSMTAEGMAVIDDSDSSVTVTAGVLQYVVIDATYNPSGDAIINLRCVNASDFSAFRDKYICICTVDMTGVSNSFVSMANINYAARDQVSPVVDSKYLGYYTTESLRNAAYPSAVPTKQRVGDFSIIGTNSTTLKFSFWGGSSWVDFVNPGNVMDALTSHIQNMNMHTTQNEKSALRGTVGSPSDTNRFITNDDPRVLSSNERAGLTNALGGGVSGITGTNPVVAKNTVIAVPRVFQVAVPVSGDTITINAGVLGLPELVVYLGKQGILSSGVSSAVQYFAVEDDFGNGYISTIPGQELPVYVIDVRDNAGNSINPDALSDSQGFYNAGGANIRLVLSANVAASARPSVRLNLRGDLSAMTPNWPGTGGTSFLPAITAFRNGKQSFASALQAEFNSLVVGSRAGSNPNLQIRALSQQGTSNKTIQLYFNRGTTPVTTMESIVDGTGVASTTFIGNEMFFLHSTQAGNRGMRISSDGAQISAGGFHVTDSSLSTNIAGLDQTGRFTAAAGLAIAPAYRFNSTGESTGFYYVPESIYSSGNYALDILNGVGLSINGKTALFVGRVGDTSGLTGSDECQMMLLQSVTDEGYVDYFLGVHDNLSGASTPGVFSIGKVDDTINSYSTALAIDYKTDEIRSNYSFRTTKQIIGKNQSLVVDEAAPAFAFTNATNTGMFYVDYWDNDAGVTFSNGVGFSINGKAAFVVTRDSSVTSNAITAGVMTPLILNQSVQNTNEVYYDFIASDSEASGSQVGGMRFGFIEYTSAFNPVLSLINAGSQSYIDVNADMNFIEYEHSIKFVDSVSIDAGGVYFISASQKLGVDSNSIYIGDLGTSSVKVVRASKSIELTGTTTINAASGISNATLNFNYGNDGAISVSGTGMLISYGSSNSDSAKIGWGYSGVQRGFLSASGFVFAQRNDAGVSYGFSASNGNAVPNIGIGTSATGMVFYGDVNSSGAFANTATATFNHLVVTGTISIPGTLNIAGLTTGSLQATSIYVPFSTTTTTTIMNTLEFTTAVGVASSTLSVGTLSAVNAEVTGNLYGPTIDDLRDKWRSPSQDLILNLHLRFNGSSNSDVDWFADLMSEQYASPFSYSRAVTTPTLLNGNMSFKTFNNSVPLYPASTELWNIGNTFGTVGSIGNLIAFNSTVSSYTGGANIVELMLNRNIRRINYKAHKAEVGTVLPALATHLIRFRFSELESSLNFDHVFEVLIDTNSIPVTTWDGDGIKFVICRGDATSTSGNSAVTFFIGGTYMQDNFVDGKGLFAIRAFCDGAGQFKASICDITKRARTFPTW